mmetsp:Transcript_21515/g.43175  ORF Transcript_21515/g.43175 Transcript_21515/m.43175 type:complete len:147 (+) Transcript_21515:168-608(+)
MPLLVRDSPHRFQPAVIPCHRVRSQYGVHLISQSLKHNTTLIELSLAGNSIGDTGATLLAASLQENNTLEILNLESNGIGCEGTKSIVDALLHNTVLRCLALSENPIGDDGAKAILRCLRDTSSLHNLLYNSKCHNSIYHIEEATY